jgi:hypothetical protein
MPFTGSAVESRSSCKAVSPNLIKPRQGHRIKNPVSLPTGEPRQEARSIPVIRSYLIRKPAAERHDR